MAETAQEILLGLDLLGDKGGVGNFEQREITLRPDHIRKEEESCRARGPAAPVTAEVKKALRRKLTWEGAVEKEV